MDKCINLSLVCLLIIPILAVACNDVNGTAYAQLLKPAATQTPSVHIRILLENAVPEIRSDTNKALANISQVGLWNSPPIQTLKVIMNDGAGLFEAGSVEKARLDQHYHELATFGTNNENTPVEIIPTKPLFLTSGIASVTPTVIKTSALNPSYIRTQTSAAIISQSTPTGSNTTKILPFASSIAQCMVIPGPAMTFREICPNANNATTPGRSEVQTSPQPAPGTSPPALSSARAPTLTNPAVNTTSPFTPLTPALQQPPHPVNPPLIPSNK